MKQQSFKRRMGFAAMDPERARAIQARGGAAVAADPAHMSAIGRLGGLRTQRQWRKAQKGKA